jgi:hypothetical protein
MVTMQTPEPAAAPAGLLDCIFRRGKWARMVQSAPQQTSEPVSRDDAVRRYALAALDNQTRKVEGAGKGTRNQTLNDAALSLGHLVAAGALGESMVLTPPRRRGSEVRSDQ